MKIKKPNQGIPSAVKSSLKLCLVISLMGIFSSAAVAKDKKDPDGPPKLVYHGIPSNWDYYALDPKIIESQSGEETKKVCLDDDFIKTPKNYRIMQMRARGSSRNGRVSAGGGKTKFILLQGGVDFSVIGEETVVIQTPETGAHVMDISYCKHALRRAKFISFVDGITRSSPNRCFKRSKEFTIMTRLNGGFDACKIESIRSWKGPVSLEDLKPAGDASLKTIPPEE